MNDFIKIDPELQKKEEQSLQLLIDSKSLPAHITNTAIAYTIVQYGKELGIGPMEAIHDLIPINGRLGLSAKLQGALAKRGNVRYKLIRDCEYLYIDDKGNELYTKGRIKDRGHNDQVTTIEFTRYYPDGNHLVQEVSFTLKDAVAAGVLDKDNWKKWLKNMMYARCLSKGLNIVAPDILKNMYSADELFDASNMSEESVQRNEDGSIVDIVETNFEEM